MEAYIWLFLYYWYWSSAKNVIVVQEFPVKIMKLERVDTALKEIIVGSWSDCSFVVEQKKQQHPEQVPEGESKCCHIPTGWKAASFKPTFWSTSQLSCWVSAQAEVAQQPRPLIQSPLSCSAGAYCWLLPSQPGLRRWANCRTARCLLTAVVAFCSSSRLTFAF